jgi:hypothetical protein
LIVISHISLSNSIYFLTGLLNWIPNDFISVS